MSRSKKDKADDKPYKIVCISLYHTDIDQLAKKVATLRKRGHTSMNKSKLIRIALRQLDLDDVPDQH